MMNDEFYPPQYFAHLSENTEGGKIHRSSFIIYHLCE